MTEQNVYGWLHNGWYGTLMVHVPWLYSALQVVHFFGLCVMMGALIVLDLTVMGFLPLVPLSRALKLVPYAIFGFSLNFISGLGFICFNPSQFWTNPDFRLKMLGVLLAGVNAFWFTVWEQPKLLARGDGAPVHWSAKMAAGLSLTIWVLVILAGRLIPTFQVDPG
jgi:hypothetical protein